MNTKQVVFLAILLVILAGVFAVKITPVIIRQRADRERRARIQAEEAERARALAPKPLSRAARLADGSFNPIPPVKAPCTADPAALLARMPWRQRYAALLAPAQPSPSRPAFYVYPFLDRTPEGVGLHCTYGWHLAGEAALAQWSDARLAGGGEPQHYGIPVFDEENPGQLPTREAWIRQALDDPETRSARYIVIGFYDFDPYSKQYSLSIRLVDRESPAQARDLLTSASASRGTFPQLASAQRAAARRMVEKLTELGLVHARPAAPPRGLDLEREIGEVACMLDAADSWAVMDGIDRALALARLYPSETLPLQAAAYGLNVLYWSYYRYAIGNIYCREYALRAYALSQIAMAMDSKPAMTNLNWTFSRVPFSHRMPDPNPREDAAYPPELALYRAVVTENHAAIVDDQAKECQPDWLVLWHEKKKYWFSRNTSLREYYNQRIARWDDHDLYLMALMQGFAYDYKMEMMEDFYSNVYASVYATRGLIASEVAAVLAGLGADASRAAEMLEILVSEVKLDRERMLAQARAGDYYALRKQLMAAFKPWQPVASGNHPVFSLLASIEKLQSGIGGNSALHKPFSGFSGFEFTPAARIRFTANRDHYGNALLSAHEGEMHSVYEAMLAISRNYLKVRPSNASALLDLCDQLYTYQAKYPDVPGLLRDSLRSSYLLCPLSHYVVYLSGYAGYYEGKPALGDFYLKEYRRMDPFDDFSNMKIGMLYRRYGYHAKAVKHLEEFLKCFPERYDIANERAWSLCQMGRWTDPDVRATFARPVPRLPGNPTFHTDQLNYLAYWIEDLKAAREAAAYYRKNHPGNNDSLFWQAQVEILDGQTTRALEFLGQARGGDLKGLSLASFHTMLGNYYLDLDRIDLAETQVKAAASIDSWQNGVIGILGRLAYVRKDYDRALKEYERALDRYGFHTDNLLWVANCLEKKGEKAKAITRLEQRVLDKSTSEPEMDLCCRLMRYYAEEGQADKARKMMDMIVRSPVRTRAFVLTAARSYEKIDASAADDIVKRIDQIMAGPEE